ncbi:MAG: Alpha-amylase/alpha-mannosidase [Myxococcales bacterium]|nr:Alpha-amylase/alpha-mannosidase [Myxococcales bacterium]
MSQKWVCIHGHFYQPPRENPWLEAIEPQPSAHPYRDWNERITAECYRPNSAARVVDGTNHIIQIVDNYERMSFNVGPTLMSWLEQAAPDVYDQLIVADRESIKRFSGHGSAMAQAYNHMIMPLASARDRATQVRWGIADFKHRYGRMPEGMWLAECAVDTASLEALVSEGILFTVLAPHQAKAWRPPGGAWRTQAVDPGRVYRCLLPSGRSIDLFFYDGATSQAVAFERLLADGHQIISRMIARGPAEGNEPTLCHIATDGETYGHHHRYGDMALAWALSQVEQGWNGTRLTNYAEFRAKVPATWDVQLAENTSWSCAHGTARWREDCGCNSGGHPGWNQKWRRPLRDALDWLRDQADLALERIGGSLFRDPWRARDAYIDVVLVRTPASRDRFLADHASHALSPDERVRALSLMEMTRHAMLMYTSCGWFFDDLSGIETVQCIQYAARAAELLGDSGGPAVESEFVHRLAMGKSNLATEGDGRKVWTQRVVPARVDPEKVCAHVAVHTLVEPDAGKSIDVYGYHVDFLDRIERRSGRARMVAGTVRVRSQLTEATTSLCFAGLHLGEQHVTGGVRPPPDAEVWTSILDELNTALKTADVFAAQRAIDRHFPGAQLSLSALLPGSRERVLSAVLGDAISNAEEELAIAYDTHAPLIRWLVAHDLPVPAALQTTAEATLRRRVLVNLRSPAASIHQLRAQIDEAAEVKVSLDTPEIALAASEGLRRLVERVAAHDGDLDPTALDTVVRAAEVAVRMRSSVDLWFAQNATWRLLDRLPELRRRAAAGDPTASQGVANLEHLAGALRLALPT